MHEIVEKISLELNTVPSELQLPLNYINVSLQRRERIQFKHHMLRPRYAIM